MDSFRDLVHMETSSLKGPYKDLALKLPPLGEATKALLVGVETTTITIRVETHSSSMGTRTSQTTGAVRITSEALGMALVITRDRLARALPK